MSNENVKETSKKNIIEPRSKRKKMLKLDLMKSSYYDTELLKNNHKKDFSQKAFE